MTANEVMKQLEKLGDAQTRKTFQRHGCPEGFSGVKVGDMKTIVKKIKIDSSLAKELYRTGNPDAQYFAGLIADGKDFTRKELDEWAKKQKRPGARLVYREEKGNAIPLLELPTGFDWQLWTAPMSLRDVEPSVNLVLRDEGRSDAIEPAWTPASGCAQPRRAGGQESSVHFHRCESYGSPPPQWRCWRLASLQAEAP